MSDYDDDIAELVEKLADETEANTGESGRHLATSVLRSVDAQAVEEMAVRYLAGAATDLLRKRTAEAERRAEKEAREWLRENARAYRESPEGKAKAAREEERRAAKRRRSDEDWAEERARVRKQVDDAFDDLKNQIRMEWTQELLGSTFAMRDGKRVTWGDATVEQHRERAEMFEGNAIANAQGAARHRHAIDALTNSGAASLREMTAELGATA